MANDITTHNKNELPHDLLAEKSFIGCLLVDTDAFDDVSDLRPVKEDFYHKRYGIIFEAIMDLVTAHSPVDYVSVHSKLKDKGMLEVVGGSSFLSEIVESQASAANIHHYAQVVKEKSALRNIIRTSNRVAELAKSHKGDVGEFIKEVEATFFKLTNDAKAGRMQKLNTVLRENMKEIEDQRKFGDIQGLPTGYQKLDECLLGMRAGQLIIVASRPAMGKTSLAMNIAHHACIHSGLPVAVFSLEMMASELSMRLLTSKAKIDSKKVKTKNFSTDDLGRIGDAVEVLSTLPIFINDSGHSTIVDIQSQCRKIKAEQGLGLIIIDYLQLMGSHNKKIPSREQEISEISRGLKSMAKELECPVIALSQLNRGVEARPNKRPNNSDLRESGAIEQDADVVMFVYRDEVYNPNDTKDPGIAEIIVGKNRSGETGSIRLKWVGNYTSFENLAAPYEQAGPGF